MDYKYHDSDKAKFILENGFIDNHIFTDMKILALYYRDILGYKPKKREEELYKFCEQHIENYNKVLFFRIIDKALNNARNKKKKLIDIYSIPIYKNEIDYIHSLPIEYNLQKIIFTILVKIKLNKEISKILSNEEYDGYFSSKNLTDKEIIKLSNINNNKNLQYFYYLEQIGYITTYYSGSMKINILYNIPINKDEIAIEIKDYNNIGYYYDYYYNNNRIKLCEICQKPFKANSNNSKYCKEHQGYQHNTIRKVCCVDCGKEFIVDSRAVKKNRCDDCYKKYRRIQERNRMRKKRNKLKENANCSQKP